MQITGLLNQLSAASCTTGTRRSGAAQSTDSFEKTLQQRQINQVKKEIYDKFQISVGTYGKDFSCYIPSSVLYKMGRNPQMKEKVYDQLESYSPDNYQASIEGLNPPVKKCTLIFDEGGNATATLEAAASDEALSSTANSLYQAYLLQQAAMLPYQMGNYGLSSLSGGTGYNLGSLSGNFGYGLNSLYGGYSYPYTTSLNGLGSLYKSNSLFSTVMSRLSQRI